MTYEDFIEKTVEETTTETEASEIQPAPNETETPEIELDVQKEVVAALAADKAEQSVEIEKLRTEKGDLEKKVVELETRLSSLDQLIGTLRRELENVGDILSRNSETEKSNQVALLDRNLEIEDHFEGETRDHVLEALKEARDASEADGRARRAQLLESVLVANEPSGMLAKRRAALEKLFNDNQNVINGQVINELDKLGIAYKLGENYLLTKEIIKRVY